MEQRNNRFKGKNKEPKKEYTRRWQLRDKIRKKEETEWKQLQSALRSSAIKEIMNDTVINYTKEENNVKLYNHIFTPNSMGRSSPSNMG